MHSCILSQHRYHDDTKKSRKYCPLSDSIRSKTDNTIHQKTTNNLIIIKLNIRINCWQCVR
jgi:hypothetical protein